MKVSELIEYLGNLPQEYLVVVPDIELTWQSVDGDFVIVDDERKMVHL